MAASGILLAALGLGALLLTSSSKKPTPPGPTPTRPLDPNMPPEVDARMRQVLATVTDPAVLEQLANASDMSRWPNTAAALRARAAQLRGQIAIPGVPVPPPPPVSPPPVSPPTPSPIPPWVPPESPTYPPPTIPPPPPGPAVPPPASPGIPPALPPPPPTPVENLDPSLPPALGQSVAALLAKPEWTDQDLQTGDALANTLQTSGFPIAAAKLRAKAMAVRAQRAGSVLLGTITEILTKPPGQLPPVPPTTSLPGTPPIVTVPPATSPGTPPPTAPLSKTYKAASGDTPSKIAQKFTGSADASRVRELAAANADKSARILAGTLYAGEILTLPDAWPAKPTFAVPTAPPPPPAPSPLMGPHATIQRGSSGADVVLWQQIVGVAADGQFGPNTESATRAWQAQRGITADGVVGPLTWQAAQGTTLASTPVAPPPAPPIVPVAVPAPSPLVGPHATLQQGSTGPDVVLWQRIVGVAQDGKFGPGTAQATRTWQAQRGLTADGIVGAKTWAAAQGAVVPAVAPPVPIVPIASPAPSVPPVAVPRPPTPPPAVPPPVARPAPPAPPPTTSHATIQQGSTGPDVVLWQKIVGVAQDGKFGSGTAQATKAWQAKRGLTADGIVGPKSWAAALGSSTVAAGYTGAGVVYHVQANDTPFTIAHRFTGDGQRMFELAEVNPDAAANLRNGIVFQGQILNLPAGWSAEPSRMTAGADALAGVLDIIGASHGGPSITNSDDWGA